MRLLAIEDMTSWEGTGSVRAARLDRLTRPAKRRRLVRATTVSGGLVFLVVAVGGAVLVMTAGLLAWRRARARRRMPVAARPTLVVWMRAADSRDVHAIRQAELRAGLSEVEPIGLCGGPWPAAALVSDPAAERCPVCVREVGKVERWVSDGGGVA